MKSSTLIICNDCCVNSLGGSGGVWCLYSKIHEQENILGLFKSHGTATSMISAMVKCTPKHWLAHSKYCIITCSYAWLFIQWKKIFIPEAHLEWAFHAALFYPAMNPPKIIFTLPLTSLHDPRSDGLSTQAEPRHFLQSHYYLLRTSGVICDLESSTSYFTICCRIQLKFYQWHL